MTHLIARQKAPGAGDGGAQSCGGVTRLVAVNSHPDGERENSHGYDPGGDLLEVMHRVPLILSFALPCRVATAYGSMRILMVTDVAAQ